MKPWRGVGSTCSIPYFAVVVEGLLVLSLVAVSDAFLPSTIEPHQRGTARTTTTTTRISSLPLQSPLTPPPSSILENKNQNQPSQLLFYRQARRSRSRSLMEKTTTALKYSNDGNTNDTKNNNADDGDDKNDDAPAASSGKQSPLSLDAYRTVAQQDPLWYDKFVKNVLGEQLMEEIGIPPLEQLLQKEPNIPGTRPASSSLSSSPEVEVESKIQQKQQQIRDTNDDDTTTKTKTTKTADENKNEETVLVAEEKQDDSEEDVDEPLVARNTTTSIKGVPPSTEAEDNSSSKNQTTTTTPMMDDISKMNSTSSEENDNKEEEEEEEATTMKTPLEESQQQTNPTMEEISNKTVAFEETDDTAAATNTTEVAAKDDGKKADIKSSVKKAFSSSSAAQAQAQAQAADVVVEANQSLSPLQTIVSIDHDDDNDEQREEKISDGYEAITNATTTRNSREEEQEQGASSIKINENASLSSPPSTGSEIATTDNKTAVAIVNDDEIDVRQSQQPTPPQQQQQNLEGKEQNTILQNNLQSNQTSESATIPQQKLIKDEMISTQQVEDRNMVKVDGADDDISSSRPPTSQGKNQPENASLDPTAEEIKMEEQIPEGDFLSPDSDERDVTMEADGDFGKTRIKSVKSKRSSKKAVKPTTTGDPSAEKLVAEKLVVVYKAWVNERSVRKTSPLSRLISLGYTKEEVLQLQSDVVDLILVDLIAKPKSGIPTNWLLPMDDKTSSVEVQIMALSELGELRAAKKRKSQNNNNERRERPEVKIESNAPTKAKGRKTLSQPWKKSSPPKSETREKDIEQSSELMKMHIEQPVSKSKKLIANPDDDEEEAMTSAYGKAYDATEAKGGQENEAVVYFDSIEDEVKLAPLKSLYSLGFSKDEVLNLRPSALATIVADQISRPRKGPMPNWQNNEGDKDDGSSSERVQVMPFEEANELVRADRVASKSRGSGSSSKPTASGRRRRRRPAEAPPQQQNPRKRSGRSRERSAYRADGSKKTVYSGRQRSDYPHLKRSRVPYPPQKGILRWMDYDKFSDLLATEAEMRLRVMGGLVGTDFSDAVKDECEWRLGMYEGWLRTLDRGIGSPIVPSRRERRIEPPPRNKDRDQPTNRGRPKRSRDDL